MNFRCCDGGRYAAVRVALEEPDRLLPRGIVSKGVVDLRIDQAWDRDRAVRIDDDIARFQRFA